MMVNLSETELALNMNLLQQFKNYVQQQKLFHAHDRVLLAVSGGVDSVMLCELCRQAGYAFAIAHCNFKLRGEESERDAGFVKKLAKYYEVDFFYKEFDTEKFALQNKLSVQEAARELRYNWFKQLLKSEELPLQKTSSAAITSLSFVATAHHADDNAETILMNFFKGTGIAGLRGMLPKNEKIVRPLLFARREAIVQFAKHNQLHWVEDSSNISDKYSRNYFRHQVVPVVEKVFPNAIENLLANSERFRDIELLYQQAIEQHKKKLIEKKGDEIHIPVLKLKKSSPLGTIVFEIIKDYGFTAHQVYEVMNLLGADTGKYVQSSTHRIIKNRNWIIIAPNQLQQPSTILIEGPGSWQLETGRLELECINSVTGIPGSANIACIDADEISFPLILRKWKQGDYFYPLGMNKKKKLSRFFIDLKLSKTEKEKVFVLESNRKIIWVVGYRIDERVKITPGTKKILKLSLEA